MAIKVANILGVRAIVTGKHTELTVAITGGATVLRVGYKTMLRAEVAEFFVFLPHL